MRTIIAGSRTGFSYQAVERALHACGWMPTVVVSGTARGVDTWGEWWAFLHRVPCERYPADWNRFGKSAGYRRNEQMARRADAAVLLWDGCSPGTRHMRDLAVRVGLRVFVWSG